MTDSGDTAEGVTTPQKLGSFEPEQMSTPCRPWFIERTVSSVPETHKKFFFLHFFAPVKLFSSNIHVLIHYSDRRTFI